MKKLLCVAIILSAAAIAAFAQSASATGQPQTYTLETEHYRVISDTGHDAAYRIGKDAEALFGLFEDYFHFASSRLSGRLNVRYFGTKEKFDAYLTAAAGESRSDFVYLQYPTADKSEVVCWDKGAPSFNASLAHILFSQFLRGFVANPPIWIREGFAAFFETAFFDMATGTLSFPENLAWLETAKAIQADPSRAMDPITILSLKPEVMKTRMETAYPMMWALVSFLTATDAKNYNRFLWDSISALSPKAGVEDNTAAVAALAFAWIGKDAFSADFNGYLAGRMTYSEIISSAVSSYDAQSYEEAAEGFARAAGLDPSDPLPHYYLGLIAYAEREYESADKHYADALRLGTDTGLVEYALGVSAYAQNKVSEARTHLAAAKAASPGKFGVKVDEILKKIP
jgi:tetratricopeptide (TPR) repeat protein